MEVSKTKPRSPFPTSRLLPRLQCSGSEGNPLQPHLQFYYSDPRIPTYTNLRHTPIFHVSHRLIKTEVY